MWKLVPSLCKEPIREKRLNVLLLPFIAVIDEFDKRYPRRMTLVKWGKMEIGIGRFCHGKMGFKPHWDWDLATGNGKKILKFKNGNGI